MLQLLTAAALVAPVLAAYVNQSREYNQGRYGDGPYQEFVSSHSKPVLFNFQKFPISAPEDEYLFLAPRGQAAHFPGPYIFDRYGELVWDGTAFGYGQTMTYKPTMYQGKPVLAVWQGDFNINGYGNGQGVILDNRYKVVANVSTTVQGAGVDFHEFTIQDDHAFISVYPVKRFDLSGYQNNLADPRNGYILDGVAQEIDITTGRAVWTWSALDHVHPSQCYVPPGNSGSRDAPWDYFHINSVAKDSKGNYLISSRHCSAVYYVRGSDGSIIWTLGGRSSSFTLDRQTSFSFQHDARWRDNETTISLFDNAATGGRGASARGLHLRLDVDAKTVSLLREMTPFLRVPSAGQGNVDRQDNGNWILGWGNIPYLSETSQSGELLWAAQFGYGDVQSYSAHRSKWVAYPDTKPDVAVRRTGQGYAIFVSWNGATEVRQWEIYGIRGSQTTSYGRISKAGFETTFYVQRSDIDSFFVKGLTGDGKVLGTSRVRQTDGGDGGDATV